MLLYILMILLNTKINASNPIYYQARSWWWLKLNHSTVLTVNRATLNIISHPQKWATAALGEIQYFNIRFSTESGLKRWTVLLFSQTYLLLSYLVNRYVLKRKLSTVSKVMPLELKHDVLTKVSRLCDLLKLPF